MINPYKKNAKLVLSNGIIFPGFSFGASGTAVGEIVFNTGMTGYQEVITDPSYYGQILTCLLYTSPSPRDNRTSRMPSSA